MIKGTMVAAVVAAFALAGTGTAAADIGTPVVNVDTAKVAQSLEAALGGGNTVGYAYAITENGQLAKTGAAGKARLDENIAFTPNTRIDIMSATKNVVAAALLKATESAGLTPETPIWSYLPPDLRADAAPSWQQVKIKHILGHTSGLGQVVDDPDNAADAAKMTPLYAGIKFTLTKPVTAGASYRYENLNYSVARIVLPRLWRLAEPSRGLPDWIGPNSAPYMLYYVNEKLFAPAGIPWTTCLASNPDTAPHAYSLSDPGAGGSLFQLSGANFESCPSYRGLHMSAVDMVRWQAHLRHGTVVSPTVRQWMDSQDLGWRPHTVYTFMPAGGEAHGGGYTVNGRSINTCHGKFPGNVEVSVVVNSQIKSGTHPCSIVATAVKSGS
ncbi:serine hydrolase domain-containing protein [Kribbella sp. NPDC023855]|uniref:serine hydrolase domain-containing protein n=1 Tax=Kribbella sp. NPDC023855 TaxID=3154698 RepID=UPI0033C21D95